MLTTRTQRGQQPKAAHKAADMYGGLGGSADRAPAAELGNLYARAMRISASGRRSVLAGEHENRNLSRGLALVFADGRGLRDQLRPQFGAGGVVQLLRQYRERLGTDLDGDPRVGPEVVVPVWVGGRSSIGGDDRQAAVSLRVAGQRCDAFDPGSGANVVDENNRGARQGAAGASLVRPELLNDVGIEVTGPPWAGFAMISSSTASGVLVMAADPGLERLALVAAFGSPVEDRVVAHQELDPARRGRIGLVDGAAGEREGAHRR